MIWYLKDSKGPADPSFSLQLNHIIIVKLTKTTLPNVDENYSIIMIIIVVIVVLS